MVIHVGIIGAGIIGTRLANRFACWTMNGLLSKNRGWIDDVETRRWEQLASVFGPSNRLCMAGKAPRL